MLTDTAGMAAACLLVALAGCAGLPSLQNRPATHALEPDASTPLGQTVTPAAQGHPGKSGITAIPDGRVAFASRVQLARVAVKSIDIQTFIWHDDATGILLYQEMLHAAARGVRVRLLLDDANTTPAIDRILAMLMQQPHIELRLYNPFVNRGSKVWGFLTDFNRLNHRMHNKSFTVDNLVSIVGGRNIADEYFEVGQDTGLIDFDVMAVGEAVRAVSAEFDLFWNSASAYPAETLLAHVKPTTVEDLALRAEQVLANPQAAAFGEAIARTTQVRNLLEGRLDIEWTTARLINDDPAKTLRPSSETQLQLLPQLDAAFGSPSVSLELISPYFVPGEQGTTALTAMARRGVKVRVLTNSLAATDELSVHAGYSKRRLPLLRAGVQLYELKPEAAPIKEHEREIGSSAKAGLHAKTYAVDGRAIFVGSFNLDPRSEKLNTEMGLVIDSSALAGRLAKAVDNACPDLAYRVKLQEDGTLLWEDGIEGHIYTKDPETSWGRRTLVRIETWLPIDWLL